MAAISEEYLKYQKKRKKKEKNRTKVTTNDIYQLSDNDTDSSNIQNHFNKENSTHNVIYTIDLIRLRQFLKSKNMTLLLIKTVNHCN